MKTDVIRVTGSSEDIKRAFGITKRYCDYMGISKDRALNVRHLVEESFGVIGDITDDFKSDFWIESDKDSDCRICFAMIGKLSKAQKQELIKSSTKSINSSSGLTSRIMSFLGKSLAEENKAKGDERVWTLSKYKNGIDEATWNGMGKSIIAKLADDICIEINDEKIKIVVIKNSV